MHRCLLLAASAALLLAHRLRGRSAARPKRKPRVALVGAGPGDPDLMTFAAASELARADVVIADLLVPPQLLQRFVPPGVELKIANKTKGNAHAAQEELQRWTLEALRAGRNVVRLKGGDPFMFGRGGEEVGEFLKHGFEVKVVPGVSSALAGPMAAGLAVTTRGVANELAICTVHGKRDAAVQVPAPFNPQRTVVFLMSVSRLDVLQRKLVEAGYPEALRVVVCERATMPGQRRIVTSVADLFAQSEALQVQSPAVVVVGGTAQGIDGVPWEEVRWEQGGVVFAPGGLA